MKSYNQLNVDTYSVFLKEWNALSEETRREILEEIIEENELEVSEEELKEVALTLGTSPIWAPKVAGAVMTAVGAGGMIYDKWRKNQQKKAEEKWLKGNLQSGETYSSGSQEKGINKSYTPPGNNNKNNKNNGNGKLKKAVTAGVVGSGVVGGVNTLSGNKDKSTETNYTNQLKKKNNNGSSSSPSNSNRNTTKSKLKFEL